MKDRAFNFVYVDINLPNSQKRQVQVVKAANKQLATDKFWDIVAEKLGPASCRVKILVTEEIEMIARPSALAALVTSFKQRKAVAG